MSRPNPAILTIEETAREINATPNRVLELVNEGQLAFWVVNGVMLFEGRDVYDFIRRKVNKIALKSGFYDWNKPRAEYVDDAEALDQLNERLEERAAQIIAARGTVSLNNPNTTALRIPGGAGSGLQVDRASGLIRGVSVITLGPAKGHGFTVDAVLLQQVASQINAAGGVRVRLGHPTVDDGVGLTLGRLFNARVEGNRVRGDVQLGEYAKTTANGNLWDYVLGLAAGDPDLFGLSVVFVPSFTTIAGERVARSGGVVAADFVSDPAANPSGLLARPPAGLLNLAGPSGIGAPMNPALLAYLRTLGLSANATDAEAHAFLASLAGDQATVARALSTPAATATATAGAASTTTALADPTAIAMADKPRRDAIVSLSHSLNLGQAWASEMVNGGFTLEQAKSNALDRVAATHKPLQLSGGDFGGISIGMDSRQQLSASISDAISLQNGVKLSSPRPGVDNLRGLSITEIGRVYLNAWGVDTRGMSRSGIARALFDSRLVASRVGERALAAGTGDFPQILADSLGKSLRQGYAESPRTWSLWAKRGTAPDFKQQKRPILSELPTPAAIAPAGEYIHTNPSDAVEVFTLQKYGHIVSLSWEALMNDDLNAFATIISKQGAAAGRLEDDVAYAPLTSNQTMTEDNVALFHTSSHKNLASSGAVLSLTTISAGRAKMRLQTGPKGATLSLMAAHLLVPVEIADLARQIVASTVAPGGTNATENYETIRALTVVEEPRLSTASATAWYLAARNSTIDTVEVCFLQDEPQPVLLQEEEFERDVRKFKVRHTVAGRALDYRGLYKNPGA